MDSYQAFLARALHTDTANDTNDPATATTSADHPAGGAGAAAQMADTENAVTSPPPPAWLPHLEDRVTKAIAAARRSFKSQQKLRAAKDLEFIRARLDSVCASAEDVMNSWPRLKIPDSSSEDLTEWPTPAPTFKPNPPGVVHPAPSARVFRGPKTDITSINNQSIASPVWVLPSHPRVPPYKSWTGLRRNQVSIETGQKMFYTDAEGETVPLSDDEGTFLTVEQHESRVLDGLKREETNAILLDVISQLKLSLQEERKHGDTNDANKNNEEVLLEILAYYTGITLGAMEDRLEELKGSQQQQQQQQQFGVVNSWKEKYDFDSLDTDFHTAFCRMCRKFGCRIHTGAHPRPVMGPLTLTEEKEREKEMMRRANGRWRSSKESYDEFVIAEREPCGNQCYRLFLNAQQLETEAREAAAAAVEVAQEEEEKGEEEDDDDDDDDEEGREEDIQQGDESLHEGNPDSDIVVLNSEGIEVIDLVSSDEDTPMVVEEIAKDEENEKEAEKEAAVEHGEVTSPVKKVENNDIPEPPLPAVILPALGAVLNNSSGSAGASGGSGRGAAAGNDIKSIGAADEISSKARYAARAAAAQTAPLSASRLASAIIGNNSGGIDGGGGGAAAPVAALIEAEDVNASLPLPTTSNADANATKQPQQQQHQQQASESPWELWEDAALEKGIEIWGRQPCKIAALIGSRTCSQIRARMMTLIPSPLPQRTANINTRAGGNTGGGAYRNNNNATTAAAVNRNNYADGDGIPHRRKRKSGKNAQPSAVYERLKRSKEDAWPQYHPCGCQGPCKESCPCLGDVNFCEKFCGCNPEFCGNRFQGCQCKCGTVPGKRCTTRQCPCLAAGRECDPDLCRLCIPTLHNTNEPGYQCNNFRLRLRQKRRVLMGLSDVQGWGAFLGGPAMKKDDFLGEYCGELIDQSEADRRGKVYDRDDNSYLFNLNTQWVIDARQKGNKLRFANHSTMANCRAEILMVDGDHRVAILASKDLVPGEELFYDYRYDRYVAPDWAQRSRDRGGGDGAGGSGSGGGRGRGRGRRR